MRVLYVIGCLEGESSRYRVRNYREYLALSGMESAALVEIDIPKRLQWACSFDIIVFFRAAFSSYLKPLIDESRKRHIPLIFDVDDLVFDPDAVCHVKAIQNWPANLLKDYLDGVRRYRATLEHCDFTTAPTQYLADYMRKVSGKPSFVLRNGVTALQIESANRLNHPQAHNEITIAYFSGSNTHQADFQQTVEPLRQIMVDFPHVRLLIVGFLEVPGPLKEFGDRVRKLNVVEWRRLPQIIAQADINLAPLEVGNPYCESKSELKYFEAALVGVPTVASPTDAFCWAINHGQNGFLAETYENWHDSLAQLIQDSNLRNNMAATAREHTLSNYTPRALSHQAVSIYQKALADFSMHRKTQ